MNRSMLALTLLVWASGCATGGGDDIRTDDINNTTLFISVNAYCDGEASALDWLVVFEADTTTDVVDLEAEVVQSGGVFGTIDLGETRPGEWYGEAWEDDLGMDCEGADFGVTFYALADDGTEETLDL